MADPNLQESAWQRAKDDAASVYKTTTFGVGLAIMELLAVPAAVLATAGHDDLTTQVAVPVISGAVALALAFLVVLAIQLAAAPVRQRDELRHQWNRAESEPKQPINIEIELLNERRKASGFYRIRRGEISHSEEDRLAAEEWTNRVVGLLTEHVDADAAREFIEAPKDIQAFKAQIDAQTAALDRIIERLTAD